MVGEPGDVARPGITIKINGQLGDILGTHPPHLLLRSDLLLIVSLGGAGGGWYHNVNESVFPESIFIWSSSFACPPRG